MTSKAKIPPAIWLAFIVVDLAIAGAVAIALFWVAPVPTAFGMSRAALAEASAPAASGQRAGVIVAVVTADSCFACQMYKRGALADARFASWVGAHAGAVHLRWGVDDEQIAGLGVERYPATVVLARGEVLATHYGAMSTDELIGFLDQAAAGASEGESTAEPEPAASPGGEPVAPAEPE